MKRITSISIFITLVIASFFSVINFIPLKKVVEENIWIEDYTQIAAHRGGAYLNPENTKMAFDYIIKETTYTDIIEFDLRLTKDNILVINHDEDINRMALEENEESVIISKHNYKDLLEYNLGRNFMGLNGKYPYKNLTIDDAKNRGLTLMKLEDFFEEYNMFRDFKLFIEIKEEGDRSREIVDHLMSMLDEFEWYKNRSMIISFDDSLIDYMWDNYMDQYIGALGNKVFAQIAFTKLGLAPLYNPKYHSIQVPFNEKAKKVPINWIDKRLIDYCTRQNQLVVYWGTDDVNEMTIMIEAGVHVITTDRPDVLSELIHKK